MFQKFWNYYYTPTKSNLSNKTDWSKMFKNNDCYQYDVKDSLQFIDEKNHFKLCKNYIFLYIHCVNLFFGLFWYD